MGIDAHQLAIVIGVTVAGAGRARLDVAHHGARIAADLVGGSSRISQHERALEASVKLSNVRSVALRGRAVGGVENFTSFAAGAFCSYTNDVARAAKTCQAPFEAKNAFAE
jgi:hypothetical protein